MPPGPAILTRVKWRPGLVAKFVVLASAIVIVTSAAGNRLLLTKERSRLFLSAEQKATLLVESAAIPFTHTLLYEEIGLLEESGLLDSIIKDLLKKPELDIQQIMVLNQEGKITAHNDYRELGQIYRDPHSVRAMSSPGTIVQDYFRSGSHFLDVATPLQLSYKRWGTLRMIISLDREDTEVRAYARGLTMMTALAILVGIGLAVAVARGLAKPIRALDAAMGRVGADLQTDLEQDRSDEIGRLQKSFLNMMDRVRNAVRERTNAQRMLQHSDRLASLGTMAAGMAHEISNPLTGLRACLERIEREPENHVQSRKYARLMLGRLGPVERVVRAMLDFARRGDSGRYPVRLSDVLREALSLAERQLRESGVRITCALPEGGPTVPGDRHQLVQVFLNLILNAVDAMPDGGTLDLSCRECEGHAEVVVRDSGCGIPDESIERIFDPFYTTKEVGQGTGLGLSIAHGIVTEMGGTIRASSRVDEGSVFCVRLPGVDASTVLS